MKMSTNRTLKYNVRHSKKREHATYTGDDRPAKKLGNHYRTDSITEVVQKECLN